MTAPGGEWVSPAPAGVEVPLTGGYSSVVVRSGDTVRRSGGPWTRTVQALLRHLHEVGIAEVPVPLGIDGQGREVLVHIEGDAASWPWPDVLLTDDGLRQVVRLVRRVGSALATFPEPVDAVWYGGERAGPGSVVRHGDLAPWNALWHDGRLVGLIDWDTAEPAPPGWDLAQAAWTFVPLRPATGYRSTGGPGPDEIGHRFGLWCEEAAVDPAALLLLVDAVQVFERDRVASWGAAGVEPQAAFLARGHVEEIEADRAWVRDRTDRLLAGPTG